VNVVVLQAFLRFARNAAFGGLLHLEATELLRRNKV